MSKHTPGPWAISSGDFILQNHAAVDAPKHGALALVVWKMEDDGRSPECEANARLIAAAPDLLEALKGLDEAYCRAGSPLSRDERHEDRMRLIAARAAIYKATGGAA
jgi:hypothetical protein